MAIAWTVTKFLCLGIIENISKALYIYIQYYEIKESSKSFGRFLPPAQTHPALPSSPPVLWLIWLARKRLVSNNRPAGIRCGTPIVPRNHVPPARQPDTVGLTWWRAKRPISLARIPLPCCPWHQAVKRLDQIGQWVEYRSQQHDYYCDLYSTNHPKIPHQQTTLTSQNASYILIDDLI